MKERPILFSGPMVRAILEGLKTQTRRVIKPQPAGVDHYASGFVSEAWQSGHIDVCCPYGKPGDRLWVRETWYDNMCPRAEDDHSLFNSGPTDPWVFYRADGTPDFEGEENEMRWRPSIFMPRWASRITLEITEVRVQRLQEITEEDAKAEGVDVSVTNPSPRGVAPIYPKNYVYARECFADLWNHVNGSRRGFGFGWDVNPWVWALTFRRVEV